MLPGELGQQAGQLSAAAGREQKLKRLHSVPWDADGHL